MSERNTGKNVGPKATRLPLVGEVIPDRHLLAMAAVILKGHWGDRRVLAVRQEGDEHWEPPASALSRANKMYKPMSEIREAGVDARVLFLSGVYPNIHANERPITMGWSCVYVSGEPTPSEGIAAVEWMPIGEVNERMSPIAAMCVMDASGGPSTSRGDGYNHDGYGPFNF